MDFRRVKKLPEGGIPRPTTEEDCAKYAGYTLIAAENAKWPKAPNSYGSSDDDPDQCDCKLVDGIKCDTEICANALTECPVSCGEGCVNNPRAHEIGVNTYLAWSEEKQFGIYAYRLIKQGKIIGEYRGDLVERKYKYYPPQENYLLAASGSPFFIDPYQNGSATSLINHGCEPNCSVCYIHRNNRIVMLVRAIKDIKPDEELTFDYDWSYRDEEQATPCHCGATNCKGFIGSKMDSKEEEEMGEENPQPSQVPKTFSVDSSLLSILPYNPVFEARQNDYKEDHIFTPLCGAYVILLYDEGENPPLRVNVGRVMECYENSHGIYFYAVDVGQKVVHIPWLMAFHHFETAVFMLEEGYSADDNMNLIQYLNNGATREAAMNLEKIPACDYQQRFFNSTLPDLESFHDPTEGLLGAGICPRYLSEIEKDWKMEDKKEELQKKKTKKMEISFTSLSSSHASSTRSSTVNQVREMSSLEVYLKRAMEHAIGQISLLIQSRLPEERMQTYHEIYESIREGINYLYCIAPPAQRRFFLFEDFKLANKNQEKILSHRFFCSLCKMEGLYNHEALLRQHFCDHHSISAKNYQCQCSATFRIPSQFRKHIMTCAPYFAQRLLMNAQDELLDAYADYVKLGCGDNQRLHVIPPGIPTVTGYPPNFLQLQSFSEIDN